MNRTAEWNRQKAEVHARAAERATNDTIRIEALEAALNELTAAYEEQQRIIEEKSEVIAELKEVTNRLFANNQRIIDDLPF